MIVHWYFFFRDVIEKSAQEDRIDHLSLIRSRRDSLLLRYLKNKRISRPSWHSCFSRWDNKLCRRCSLTSSAACFRGRRSTGLWYDSPTFYFYSNIGNFAHLMHLVLFRARLFSLSLCFLPVRLTFTIDGLSILVEEGRWRGYVDLLVSVTSLDRGIGFVVLAVERVTEISEIRQIKSNARHLTFQLLHRVMHMTTIRF